MSDSGKVLSSREHLFEAYCRLDLVLDYLQTYIKAAVFILGLTEDKWMTDEGSLADGGRFRTLGD